jgi:hypothetical protein
MIMLILYAYALMQKRLPCIILVELGPSYTH